MAEPREDKHVYYRDGYKYKLTRDFECETGLILPDEIKTRFITLSTTGHLRIEIAYSWNGPSGPTHDDNQNMLPSLPHDALYQLIEMGLLPMLYREKVDDLFWTLCIRCKMPKFRANGYWQALKWFGEENAAPENRQPELITPPLDYWDGEKDPPYEGSW